MSARQNTVTVLGVGMTPFGQHPEKSLPELYVEPLLQEALPNANLMLDDLDHLAADDDIVFHYGNHVGGRDYTTQDGDHMDGRTNIAAEIPDLLDIGPVEVKRHEAACASSAAAFHAAYHDVTSGRYPVAVAGGSEKLAHMSLQDGTAALGTATKEDLSFPEVFDEIAQHYAAEYGLDKDVLQDSMAAIAVKNRRHGSNNEKAQFYGKHGDISVDEVQNSPEVTGWLTLYDCCPMTDGGSAVVLATEDYARDRGIDDPITVAATAQRNGGTLAYNGGDVVKPKFNTSRRAAANAAYKQAGIKPENVDVAEVHDCFTIDEIKAVEDLGFVDHGTGYLAAHSGDLDVGGSIPVNLSGGLLAVGHPVGATGTRQIYSLVEMLRGSDEFSYLGDALDDAEYAVADTMGGDLGTSVVTVLQKE